MGEVGGINVERRPIRARSIRGRAVVLKKKKVVVLGATGLIGRALVRSLAKAGYEVVAVSRSAKKAARCLPTRVKIVQWDARSPDSLLPEVDGAFALVNLAGESVTGGRWTAGKKRRILESRVDATRVLVAAIGAASEKPEVLVQGSSVGYYPAQSLTWMDEDTGPGSGFGADVARRWEEASLPARAHGVRLAIARTGVVLAREAGLLPAIMRPMRWFVGGIPADGLQWVSWIHLRDEIGALRHLIENERCIGPFNLTAPAPLRMGELCRELARRTHRPVWVPLPAWQLRLLFGRKQADETVLSDQRVIPSRLEETGFRFRFPEWRAAIADLFARA
ncbi:MAG TPA: TIGR01777 family oxidoreductase [Thermoplasmata archaeon]|nr:TIGR01777 family oxidoreductase [Thermoplasmata archaeon]